jgi:geranylgeranyl diphosphate synthase type I
MFALAHLALLRLTQLGHDSDRVLRAFALFDTAALRLSEGQHLDLLHAEGRTVTAADYLRMIEGKTAALLAASTAIGALLGAGDDRTVGAFEEFGRRLGLAFQIRDDLLGIWGEEAETGKPASDDLRSRKMTYPVLVALERAPDGDELPALLQRSKRSDEDVRRASAALERLGARDESERAAREHAEAAIDALRPIDISPERRAELTALARFAADRSA